MASKTTASQKFSSSARRPQNGLSKPKQSSSLYASMKPYVELTRIHKPAGGALFFWPMVWGLAMAARARGLAPLDLAWLVLLTVPGAFVLRSSACTINDIFDRDLDAAVERTKMRPLACGAVSVPAASSFLAIQMALGAAFFMVYDSSLVFWVAMLEMGPLLWAYPLIKRFSWWPQAWLGLAVNIGFSLAWFQVDAALASKNATIGIPDLSLTRALEELQDSWARSPQMPVVNLLMIVGTSCWTMVYDTVYGCQDRAEDASLGVYSTSLLFGKRVKSICAAFGVAFIAFLLLSGAANGQGSAYMLTAVGGAALVMAWSLTVVNVDDGKSCWENFKHNAFILGPLVFSGMVADYVIHYSPWRRA